MEFEPFILRNRVLRCRSFHDFIQLFVLFNRRLDCVRAQVYSACRIFAQVDGNFSVLELDISILNNYKMENFTENISHEK